jgi:hypothetical protein
MLGIEAMINERQRQFDALTRQGSMDSFGRGLSGLAGAAAAQTWTYQNSVAPQKQKPKIKKPKTIRQELQEETNKWLKDALK